MQAWESGLDGLNTASLRLPVREGKKGWAPAALPACFRVPRPLGPAPSAHRPLATSQWADSGTSGYSPSRASSGSAERPSSQRHPKLGRTAHASRASTTVPARCRLDARCWPDKADGGQTEAVPSTHTNALHQGGARAARQGGRPHIQTDCKAAARAGQVCNAHRTAAPTQRPEGLHEQQPAAAARGGAELGKQRDRDGRATQSKANDSPQQQQPLQEGQRGMGGLSCWQCFKPAAVTLAALSVRAWREDRAPSTGL